jgi:hypothetical protein
MLLGESSPSARDNLSGRWTGWKALRHIDSPQLWPILLPLGIWRSNQRQVVPSVSSNAR